MRKNIFIILTFFLISLFSPGVVLAKEKYWDVQSIDTMKYSRDLAREKLDDKSFEDTINDQVQKIEETGATHVAVGTPYDGEFLPFLEEWVKAARANNLNVWFRGNWSGWEGWFGYLRITPEEHIAKTEQFILSNQNLFEDGDIFTPCTECENGAIGDPRMTKDVSGYREFLIKEYQISTEAFGKIGKNVVSGYFSMNGDVASLIMDRKTTESLGGVVVIDHYVQDPSQLALDISNIVEASGGEVILGEFGAPIPDIHGYMSENAQAKWIGEALAAMSKVPNLHGVNYWTSFGGTTSLWDSAGNAKPAAQVITGYFSPRVITGQIVNELGWSVKNAEIKGGAKISKSDNKGKFTLVKAPSLAKISVKANGYDEKVIDIKDANNLEKIVLKKSHENIFFRIQKFFYNLFRS